MDSYLRKLLLMDYYDFLRSLHSLVVPDAYVEIGVRNGDSLRLALPNTLCVGIDPNADIRFPLNTNTKIFNMTSDEFFERYDLASVLGDRRVDLGFIDGMHLFEYALRDFANLERYCHRDSCIVVHDCLPVDRETSTRNRNTDVWSGDVWKLVPCLSLYRPDLNITTLDVPPTGMTIITCLDHNSTSIHENMTKIIDTFLPIDFDYLKKDKHTILRVNNWNHRVEEIPCLRKRHI